MRRADLCRACDPALAFTPTGGKGRGKSHPCPTCGTVHGRRVELCDACESSAPLTSGRWVPRKGIQVWVTA